MSKNSKQNQNQKQQQGNSNPSEGSKNRQSNRSRRQQPRKDSGAKRLNYDNARVDKIAKQIMDDAKSGKFNDINDFLRNPMLLKSASSIPVFPILGSNVGTAKPAPGVMSFMWQPSVGSFQLGGAQIKSNAPGNTDWYTAPPIALNQSADSTYSFLVHANSRNYSYNAPDLFMLILAGSQVFSIIEAMKRAFGLVKRYVETDIYCPDTWLQAMGFKAQNLRENMGQAWFDLNNLIMQTRQIWVPNVFPIVSRWMDLNGHIYKDAEGDYAQTYVYVQSKYWKYDEMKVDHGGVLVPATWVDTGDSDTVKVFEPGYHTYTWDRWVAVAQSMIDALVASEDRGIIYGDLLNAYTAERIIALPEIDANYVIDREYSPEISMQVENTVVVNETMVPDALVQFENTLIPGWSEGRTWPTSSPDVTQPREVFLNFHVTSDVTPEMVVLATRFAGGPMLAAKVPQINGTTLKSTLTYVPLAAGTEVVTGVAVYTHPSKAGNTVTPELIYDNTITASSLDDVLPWLATMAFDWHLFGYDGGTDPVSQPTVAKVQSGNINSAKVDEYYGDFDKYTTISPYTLRRINDAAEFSLFGVPQI